MIKLLVTDLDDTLYSWIGFFIPAFYEMLEELSMILNVPKSILLHEYQRVHQEKGSVEYPFSTLFLPSVKAVYPTKTKEEILSILNPAFHKFNSVRKEKLQLYPGVREVLKKLIEMQIIIVGYTDSAEENGFYRLKKLNIDCYFKHVYVADSQFKRPSNLSSENTQIVSGKKPNPAILQKICKREGIAINETLYLGDSLTKDIYMAKQAGAVSVLCKYSCDEKMQKELYAKLVAISHWKKSDFEREQMLKKLCQADGIQPDYTIQCFEEILKIIQTLNSGAKS